VKNPGDTNMVIFRENSEDIYAGIEYQAGTPEAQKVVDFIINEMGATKIRFPQNVRHRHQARLREGTKRLVRKAIQYAIDQDLPS
jgi:isocitrate dehydrogenase